MALVEYAEVAGVDGMEQLPASPPTEALRMLTPAGAETRWCVWDGLPAPVRRPPLRAAVSASTRTQS